MQLLNMFPITKTMISQCYVCMASLQGEFVMCIVMSLTMSCDVKCDRKHTHKGAELRMRGYLNMQFPNLLDFCNETLTLL